MAEKRPRRGSSLGENAASSLEEDTVPQAPGLAGVAGYLADTEARDFDRLVYERVRLGILSALSVNARMSFSELKKLLGTTDGNLSVHARKLEDAGYVLCKKKFEGRVPKTEYRLSPRGRAALERYLSHMQALIEATRR